MSNPAQEAPKFSVDIIDDEETGEPTPHWYMNGQDMGPMDWEMTGDGRHGFIDYLSHYSEIKSRHLGRVALPAIAQNLHLRYPDLETVDFPDRQEVFRDTD